MEGEGEDGMGWDGWNCFFYTKITTIRGGRGGREFLFLFSLACTCICRQREEGYTCWLVAGDGTFLS